jgi:hypothetical protein
METTYSDLPYGTKVHVAPEKSYSWTGDTWVMQSFNHGTLIECKNVANEIARADPMAGMRISREFITIIK